MPHILIVEDEAAIADTLIFALQSEGFTTTWLSLAEQALAEQQRNPADLLILDIGLPDISGFEACKRLRRFSEVPVIFLTARSEEIDRVVGLEIGADDYVVKPFSPREVAARVKAILKRMAPREVPAVSPVANMVSGPFQVDSERVQIHYHDQLLSLTRHEFRLLQSLLAQPERVFSREQLLDGLGWPLMLAMSAPSTATSKACVPSCARWPLRPSRSRPIAVWVTATRRGTPEALRRSHLSRLLPLCGPDRLVCAEHGDGRNPPRRKAKHRRNPGRYRQPVGRDSA
jgi:two-component system catabolic regulation response regulator CreB